MTEVFKSRVSPHGVFLRKKTGEGLLSPPDQEGSYLQAKNVPFPNSLYSTVISSLQPPSCEKYFSAA